MGFYFFFSYVIILYLWFICGVFTLLTFNFIIQILNEWSCSVQIIVNWKLFFFFILFFLCSNLDIVGFLHLNIILFLITIHIILITWSLVLRIWPTILHLRNLINTLMIIIMTLRRINFMVLVIYLPATIRHSIIIVVFYWCLWLINLIIRLMIRIMVIRCVQKFRVDRIHNLTCLHIYFLLLQINKNIIRLQSMWQNYIINFIS